MVFIFQNLMVSEGIGRSREALLNRRFRRDLCCSLLEGARRDRMGQTKSPHRTCAWADRWRLQIFEVPDARRACRNRPAGARPSEVAHLPHSGSVHHGANVGPGAVAGMAQPAFKIKRWVSLKSAMSSRDFASTSACVPSATTTHASDRAENRQL